MQARQLKAVSRRAFQSTKGMELPGILLLAWTSKNNDDSGPQFTAHCSLSNSDSRRLNQHKYDESCQTSQKVERCRSVWASKVSTAWFFQANEDAKTKPSLVTNYEGTSLNMCKPAQLVLIAKPSLKAVNHCLPISRGQPGSQMQMSWTRPGSQVDTCSQDGSLSCNEDDNHYLTMTTM